MAGILQVDVSNAFNSISRTAIVDGVWGDYLSISVSKWAKYSFCHSASCWLIAAPYCQQMACSRTTCSARFFLQLASTASSRGSGGFRSTVPLWYQDDGVVAGKLHDIEPFSNVLAMEFPIIGLVLNKLNTGIRRTLAIPGTLASPGTLAKNNNHFFYSLLSYAGA